MTATHVIGVDLGGTKILSGLVNRDGEVERRYEIPTPVESEEALLAGLDEAVDAVRDESVGAVGFGIPSTIDQRTGRAIWSANIPLANLPFRDRMTERWKLPCGIDNDANAATIAEWRIGAGRGSDDVAMLTLGTGLGGGLILGGRPYRGSMGGGVELGHMTIVHEGRPCQGNCTGRGHLEPYVTGLAATIAAREAFGPAADAHRVVRLANEGDETAIGILAEIGHYLGSAIGTLVNIFVPEVVVIGGGFGTAAWKYLVEPAREIAAREALEPGRSLLRIVPAELGTAAGLIGAGFVAWEALETP
jgi:glucokinase